MMMLIRCFTVAFCISSAPSLCFRSVLRRNKRCLKQMNEKCPRQQAVDWEVLRVDTTALIAAAKEEEEPLLPTLPTQRRGMRVESKRILTLYGYRKAKSYEDSMASTHPDLAAELDIEECKSMGLVHYRPENIIAGTKKKLAWRCQKCHHDWIAQGSSRVNLGRGCPACANQAVHTDGRNSMASTHPDLAAELDIEECKSMGLVHFRPENIIAGTNKKLAWRCQKCHHGWIAQGNSRVSQGSGCPVCAKSGFDPARISGDSG